MPAVYNVTNGNDAGAGSLRAAITAANGTIGVQDEIQIDPNLTITLTSELPAITDNLIIVGGGQWNTVITRALDAPAFRILTVDARTDVHIYQLTIRRGDATQYIGDKNGGGILNRGNLMIAWVTVEDSLARNGGGIAHRGFGSLQIISNSLIDYNTAQENGGGVWFDSLGGRFFMQSSTLTRNDAGKSGGGMYFFGGITTTRERKIITSSIVNNESSNGGGLYIDGNFEIDRTTFQGNTANGNNGTNKGGGIFIENGTTYINQSTFLDNEALSNGGGIWLDNTANLSLIASVFSGNTAPTGKSLCIQIGAGYTFASNILDWPEVWVP
ncbi:MAG: hypothetical protein SNJ75_09470 [Gemmataceae bacterium]